MSEYSVVLMPYTTIIEYRSTSKTRRLICLFILLFVKNKIHVHIWINIKNFIIRLKVNKSTSSHGEKKKYNNELLRINAINQIHLQNKVIFKRKVLMKSVYP